MFQKVFEGHFACVFNRKGHGWRPENWRNFRGYLTFVRWSLSSKCSDDYSCSVHSFTQIFTSIVFLLDLSVTLCFPLISMGCFWRWGGALVYSGDARAPSKSPNYPPPLERVTIGETITRGYSPPSGALSRPSLHSRWTGEFRLSGVTYIITDGQLSPHSAAWWRHLPAGRPLRIR